MPPQGSVTPPGGAQSPGTEEGSYPAEKTQSRDKRCDEGSVTLTDRYKSQPRDPPWGCGQLCCKSQQVCDSAGGHCPRDAAELRFQLGYPCQKARARECSSSHSIHPVQCLAQPLCSSPELSAPQHSCTWAPQQHCHRPWRLPSKHDNGTSNRGHSLQPQPWGHSD